MFEAVAKLKELDEEEVLPVRVGSTELVLYRHAGEIRACQRYCPHQQSDLSEGIVSRGHLVCAAHGWRFDADSGQHDSSELCLATYPVKVEGEQVFVKLADG